jgi:uncharacterized protein YjbI with pentapeptide repeats
MGHMSMHDSGHCWEHPRASALHTYVVGTWWVIGGGVLAFLGAGSLLALVPERSQEAPTDLTAPTGRPVPWRNRVRRRLQRRRRLVLSYLGVVAVAVIVLVFWILPSVLTEHPRIPKSADRHKAITDTRTGLVAMLAALGAAGGLAYTARTYRLSREGQITDRYSKAVEQLGDEKIEVRLGGIYALERLMHDSPADQPTIMETLTAFVRQHALRSSRPALPGRSSPPSATGHPAEDIQAVLTVLCRRHPVIDERPINLSRTNLTGAHLFGADLTRADLHEANLTDASLGEATLTGAYLFEANLIDADLFEATLTNAIFSEANLTNARLARANLTRANLIRANLTRANLFEANLTDASLGGATLNGAQLGEANLTDANFTGQLLTRAGTYFVGSNLTDADLSGATLTGATLTDKALSPEQIANAKGTDGIKWVPQYGITAPADGEP